MTLLILLVLAVLFFAGGFGYSGGAYRSHGIGLGGILIVVLLFLLLTGRV